MKKTVLFLAIIVAAMVLLLNTGTDNHQPITQTYPWQVDTLPQGRSRVFGIVLGETTLAEVTQRLDSLPKLAVFEEQGKLSLEAYYKNISLGGLIGSFIFTLDVNKDELQRIKQATHKKEPSKAGGWRYELDRPAIAAVQQYRVKTLSYIPTVQLSEETILKRFGEPDYKIKMKKADNGWHYLYAARGLDLIYKEDEREVLEYVAPKDFNALLAPLQAN